MATSNERKVELGAGLAAGMVAAALGAYLLYGSKDAKKNRAKVKGWMLKARGEILERLEAMEEVTEKTYGNVVQQVIANYRGMKNVSAPELAALAGDLRRHWQTIKPMFKQGKKSAPRTKSRKASKRKTTKKSAS